MEQEHFFWNNKPIMKKEEFVNSKIENISLRKVYGDKPLILPDGYEWKELTDQDIGINTHGKPYLIIGIVMLDKLIGYIGGIEETVKIRDKDVVLINVVVMKSILHGEHISVVLIDEFARRCIHKGYDVGIFFSNKKLYNPVCCINVYERIIDMAYLKKSNYKHQLINLKEEMFSVRESIPENCILIDDSDLDVLYKLYKEYVVKFSIYNIFGIDEFKDIFSNKNKNIRTYKILRDDKIVDFISCIIENDDSVVKCRLLMYTANYETLNTIIMILIKIAKKLECHIVQVADMWEMGKTLLSRNDAKDDEVFEFKFSKFETRYLHLFNWKCEKIRFDQLSFVIH